MDTTTKNKKKFFMCGNFERFKRIKELHEKHKSKFKIHYRGLTRKMIFDEGKVFRFFADEGSGYINGAYYSVLVKKDINNYLLTHPAPSMPNHKPLLRYFNIDRIPRVLNKQVQALDLNNCYFRTAYNLGFITEKTYKGAMDKIKHKKKIKEGLLVAIGTLNTLDMWEVYDEGVLVKNTESEELRNKCVEEHAKYSPFYWAIIQAVYDFLMDAAKYLGRDFYMCLTDCIYFNKERRRDVIEFMKNYNYNYKLFDIEFTEIDHIKVKWNDFKADKLKEINHSHKNIWDEVEPDDKSNLYYNTERDLVKYIREYRNSDDLKFFGMDEFWFLNNNKIFISNKTKIKMVNTKEEYVVNKFGHIIDKRKTMCNYRFKGKWWKMWNYNEKNLGKI